MLTIEHWGEKYRIVAREVGFGHMGTVARDLSEVLQAVEHYYCVRSHVEQVPHVEGCPFCRDIREGK